jgi:hypothetical protein
LADIALVEILLESLGGGQHGQQPASIGAVELRRRPITLQALLDPALLLGIGDVHVLRADRAAIDLLDHRDDIAQRHAVRGVERAGVEDLIHVVRLEIVISSDPSRRSWACRAA